MANWYVSSVAYTAVTQWAALTTLAVGAIRRQLTVGTVGNERCFRVSAISTGITGSSEPTWNLNQSAATTDGGVTWTECTGQEAYQSPGNWAAPAARLTITASRGATGDTFYVASNHAETQGIAYVIGSSLYSTNGNPINILCVDSSGSSHVPPQSGDLTTGASVTTTSTIPITINYTGLYVYGVTFNVGSGSSGTASFIANNGATGWQRLDSCAINLLSTGASSRISYVSSLGVAAVEWNNVAVSFAATGQRIIVENTILVWRNTPSAISGTPPTSLFGSASGFGTEAFLEGVDLSGLGTNSFINLTANATGSPCLLTLQNCKIGTPTVYWVLNTGAANGAAGSAPLLFMLNCDNGTDLVRSVKLAGQDALETNIGVIRTGGASNGTTGYSWLITRASTNVSWANFFETFPAVVWNTTVGSAVNVTIHGIVNAAALPTNDQIWMSVAYLSDGSSTITSNASGTKANILASGAALTADSASAWDSQVTARQNSHAYSVGDIMAVADNAGRIFFCTTAGTSASSEPGGYATAVDGGSVTDGTAVFRAGVRFSQTVSCTPQQIGLLKAYVRVAQASGSFYIDPALTLS